ncbi:hypothetical protein PSEWESI4_02559 [Pseudomonas carbonaria]|uniref:YfiR family protein n=1 Tax=Zestomonas carbonaria TaxID=2762745 RepID=A0A7U7ENL3_9GAMM|nr:hypothetical protein PSEWESI4_02559 [Pseudomonas carbonaria]
MTLASLPSLRRFSVCLALLGACLSGPILRAEEARTLLAQQSEAVGEVVLGILSFVRWPDEPGELHLCVVGPTEFADDILQGMSQPSGRPVHAQRRALDDPRLATECHALYLGVLSDAENRQLFERLANHPVLSISEHDPSCSVGNMFCLNIGRPRVTFSINLDSVARSGVRVHPNVLKLARRKAAS